MVVLQFTYGIAENTRGGDVGMLKGMIWRSGGGSSNTTYISLCR